MKSFKSYISEEGTEQVKRGKQVSVGKNTVKINPDSEELKEVAPPGAKAERTVKYIKKSYSKDGKLTDRERSIAYATAWKQHNQEEIELEGDELEEGLRKRLATGALAAGLGAAALGGGAAKAGQWSGEVNARYGSVPAVATDSSVRSGVDKALANLGTSHSASEIKGKTGLTGGANISYSGNLGNSPQASKPKVNAEKPSPNTSVRRSSPSDKRAILRKTGKDPVKTDVKTRDIKSREFKKDDAPVKKFNFDGGDKPVASRTVKPGDKPTVRPGGGPAGQQLRSAISSIRDATGENKREADHQSALGPTHDKSGRLQSGGQRLRGAIDAIRTAVDSARQMDKKNKLQKSGYVPSFGTFVRESAVPGQPAERLGAVTAIPQKERDAALERIKAKTKAIRDKKKIREEFEIEEGMTMKAFKENRRKLKRQEASTDAKKRGHVGKEWYNSGRTYSPDEAKRSRANMDDDERRTRHRTAVDPDNEDDNNYSADRTKNPKKQRKQAAMGEAMSFSDFMEARRMDKEGVDRGDAGRAARAEKAKASLAAKQKRQAVLDKHEKKTGTKLDISRSKEGREHAANFPGSRQQPKERGKKETPSETQNRRINASNARKIKHGFTSKEKKEAESMAKHTSRFD